MRERADLDVVIPTRNRPDELARLLRSLAALEVPPMRVFIVDQSDDSSENSRNVAAIQAPNFVHHAVESRGRSRALNHAVRHLVTAQWVAFTDDDCEVPPDWTASIQAAIGRHPDAMIVFGQLLAIPHDARNCFVPAIEFSSERTFRRPLGRSRLLGMGADMIVRRTFLETIGGFDDDLGAGARFLSGEETELVYRALAQHHVVVQAPTIRVLHHGARRWPDEAAELMRAGIYGTMAGHGIHARAGHWWAFTAALHEATWVGWAFLKAVARGHGPFHLRRMWFLLRGFAAGLRRGPIGD